MRNGEGRVKNREKSSRNRNKAQQETVFNKAFVVLFMVCSIIIITAIGIGRVMYIKIVHGTEYEANLINTLVRGGVDQSILPTRGAILDRNQQPLSVSTTVYTVVLDVRMFVEEIENGLKQAGDNEEKRAVVEEKRQKTLETINETLGIPMETLTSYVQTDANGKPAKDTNYFVLARKVPFNDGTKIKALNYACLYCEDDNQRSYPQDSLAAQVLGFIRGDSSWGLESYYNAEMTGFEGRTFRTLSDKSNVVTQKESAIQGNTIITTIDSTLQHYAEEACKNAYVSYSPENTACIIMNPNTGEIYGMAQYPTFNPNAPTDLSKEVEDGLAYTWSTYSEKQKAQIGMEFDAWKNYKAWRNFSITETYEPGSIYKPILAAMALEQGVISPNETFNCPGVKTVADYQIKCHNVDGHGTITLEQALQDSCNVAMMEIITKIGAENYYKMHKDFGYGEKTGIDLPGEVAADSPLLSYSLEQLHSAELATSSFGQGFNATAMQSLNALTATINGGNLMKPYIVSQILDSNGGLVKENKPTVIRKVISKSTSDVIRKYLESVVKPDGTGRKAVINGYAIGGKTGTAEQGTRGSGVYTLSFIAYLPVDNPDIIAMTVIHRPKDYYDGSDISPVPMLKDVLLKIIDYKGYQPNYDIDENNEISTIGEDKIALEDYTNTNVAETLKELNAQGISYEIIGNGDTVIKQNPPAGTQVSKGTSIILNVKSSENAKLDAVPDVVGLSRDDAIKTLETAGFGCYVDDSALVMVDDEDNNENVDDDGDVYDDGDDEYRDDEQTKPTGFGRGNVFAQVPEANLKVPKNTPIKIKVE